MLFTDEEVELNFHCCGNSLLQLVAQTLESYCFEYGTQVWVDGIKPNRCTVMPEKDLKDDELEFLRDKINTQFKRKSPEEVTCNISTGLGVPMFDLLVTGQDDLMSVN